jgi:two-component system chemotaxis response regulator CheY
MQVAVMVVLVIEDSSTMRQLICLALQRIAGTVVMEATDGADALAKLHEIQPDVIITDINMPEMDGFTFLERLRALPSHAATPVIIVTTEAAQEDRSRALALGVTTYVTKPIRQNDVMAAIQTVTRARKRPVTAGDPSAVVLRVDYADAKDLLEEYTASLAKGTLVVANKRKLSVDTQVRLALAFPGMVEPLYLDGVVRSALSGDEPTLVIALSDGPQLDELAHVIERIRAAVAR